MGSGYSIICLAGEYYIDFQNENTNWEPVALKLNKEQMKKVDNFYRAQGEREEHFFKVLIEETN